VYRGKKIFDENGKKYAKICTSLVASSQNSRGDAMSLFSFLTNPYQKAAGAATASGLQAQKLLSQQWQDQLAMQMPYIQQGQQAFGLYQALTGAQGQQAQQAAMANFQMNPSAMYGLEQALKSVNRGAAASGQLFGGNRLRDISATRTQAYQNELANYIERLRAQAALGQQSAANVGGLGQAYTQNMVGAIQGVGDAKANAALGGAQAQSQLISGLFNAAGSVLGGLGGLG
jgi:hypothetical protein